MTAMFRPWTASRGAVGRCAHVVWTQRLFIILHLMLFGIVLPGLCSTLRLYHSVYHQAFHALCIADSVDADQEVLSTLSEENELRVSDAEDFLRRYVQSNRVPEALVVLEAAKNDTGAVEAAVFNIVVTIVASPRSKYKLRDQVFDPKYLTQNVANFLMLFTQTSRSNFRYHLLVCDVGQSKGEEAARISSEFPVQNLSFIHLEGSKVLKTAAPTMIRSLSSKSIRFYKEKMDYSFCINETLSLKRDTDYVMMVEDDALAKPDLLNVVNYLVENNLDKSRVSQLDKPTTNSVGYYKLYHPKRLLGYVSAEVDRIPDLLASAIVAGSLLYFTGYYSWILVRKFTNRNQTISLSAGLSPQRGLPHRPPARASTRSWLIVCLYALVVLLLVGRPHVQGWRVLSPQLYQITPDAFCCTQGVLFPRESAERFAGYIASEAVTSKNHKDDTLFEFQKRYQPGYLVQPNLFSHVGVMSSLREKVVDPHLFIDS